VSGTVDVGAGTYRPDRAIPGGVASIAPTLRYRAGPFDLEAAGVYTDAPAGRWNFQGGTTATFRTPSVGFLHAEVGAEADWTSHYRVRGTTALAASARLYAIPGENARFWFGGHSGNATALGRRRPLLRTEFGTSASIAGVELGFTLLRSSFTLMSDPGTTPGGGDSLGTQPERADSIHSRHSSLTDAMLSGRWHIGTLDFDASVGRRFSQTTRQLTLWGVSASREITPMLDLVAATGRSGSDPVTAVPGSRYLVVGLRLKLRGGPAPLLLPPAPPAGRAGFRIGPALGSGREVVVQMSRAHAVELAGDFTDWRPVPLEAWGDERWRTVLTIPPGLHRLAIRVDGGRWQAPPGARPIPSEFGGEVAEIVVE
jgi:hypothetical protein